MNETLQGLLKKTKEANSIYEPLFFRLSKNDEKLKFKELLKTTTGLIVYDELLGQVEELVKSQNPKKVFSKQELTAAALKHIGNIPHEEYGVWVYYPWSNRIVHILEKEDFITVRTNRNQYKITPQEKETLASKKIGVLGLSVGQSIALTIAMERGCGELRIADFDILELSNLNRIRTGVANLGISKTIVVAREIAELDPYFKVVCFHDGATEENMDDILLKDGKLDILVDECDGLFVKILCRQRAKHFGIPVVMDTSDRGMVDVERFDLEPNRSILHGYIDHLDITKVKAAKTNEEKVPYLLPMLGVDTISNRMKASMLEIEQTITTWPQLASSVALGGGLGADVCRRILLDQFRDSGRYFVDTEQLIGDKNTLIFDQQEELKIRPTISHDEMIDIIQSRQDKVLTNQLDLEQKIINELLHSATMAPTGANIQPWKWIYSNKNLYLFFDDRYSAGLLDCGTTTSFVGLGAAAENLILKAHQLGLEVIEEKQNLNSNSKLISLFRFFKEVDEKIIDRLEPHTCDELVESINDRLTNRNIGKRVPIEKSRLERLSNIARTIPGADLKIIDDEKILKELEEVTGIMDRIRVTHKGGHRDFLAEIRWTPEEAKKMGNGVDLIGTVDLTPTELAGWKIIKDWTIIKLLNEWKLGSGIEKIQRKSVAASSALALLTVPRFSCDNFYTGGRAFERVWLAATKDNIQVHPAYLSVLIFNTLIHNKENIFPEEMKKEVIEAREKFVKLFSINAQEERGEVILFRFFIGEAPKSRSVRYPLDQVVKFV